jgi:hypothetical protein
MGKPKLFDENQEQFILNNYQTMSNEQIAMALGENYTRSQVNSWLQHRGIKRNGLGCIYKHSIFSQSDIDFIKKNYDTMTSKEIGDILGFTAKQIRGKCCDLGLNGKRRQINDDYFENIDTSLKSYFLGFIYADGWIIKNDDSGNYEFGMKLSSKDKYLLELLNNELGGQNIIYHHEPQDVVICQKQIAHSGHCDTLRVYSKKIVCDLNNHGIEINKSLKDTIPVVDDDLFFDFLRGYIDGDGCYYCYNNQTYMHITCGSRLPLEYIQNKLNQFDIKTQLYTENERKYRLMCTSFSEMNKLIHCLYYQDDLFYLERKYEKIKHFLGLAA